VKKSKNAMYVLCCLKFKNGALRERASAQNCV
jgi:hypothetical protein